MTEAERRIMILIKENEQMYNKCSGVHDKNKRILSSLEQELKYRTQSYSAHETGGNTPQ